MAPNNTHERDLNVMIGGGPPRNWKRPVGRPRQIWPRGITADLLSLNVGPHSLCLEKAQNRDRWSPDVGNGYAPQRGTSMGMDDDLGVCRNPDLSLLYEKYSMP